MFERPQQGQSVLLVNVCSHADIRHEQEKLQEHQELAKSAGAEIRAIVSYRQDTPHPKFYLSSGRVEAIQQLIPAKDIDLVIFNCSLSPSQERNLERVFKARVLDRTGLILDIFAQRAHSFEGKLQVELAQLDYLSTRLVRGWTHLERQKGGIGLRGPGETQLETDRRLLAQRVKKLKARLEKVKKQREQGRNARKKTGIPTVSLVGYTNAGKSTLFNTLTHSNVYQADQLFATLDPTLAQLAVSQNFRIILADTVGFIKDLPHTLVEAFQSTLVETREAQLLLHVVDAGDEEKRIKIDSVNEVLAAIGAENVPQLMVFNKIDCLENKKPLLQKGKEKNSDKIWLSALSGEGINDLLDYINDFFASQRKTGKLLLLPELFNLKARLYRQQYIVDENFTEEGASIVSFDMPAASWGKLQKEFNLEKYILH